jgi:recombination protein RecR
MGKSLSGYSKPMERLIEQLGRLPGIGAKTAERLAYHVMRMPRAEVVALAQAVRDVAEKLGSCSRCFNVSETDPCPICSDSSRQSDVVCVVEQPKDLMAIERTGNYRGQYHVLGGRIAPLEGMEPEHLTIEPLLKRVKENSIKEVILALNPTMEGDTTAHYLTRRLSELPVQVTQIARGIPSGSPLEYASKTILSDALAGRRRVE